MDWLDYREKLGVGFSDLSKAQHCITNILTELAFITKECDKGIYLSFCLAIGIEYTEKDKPYNAIIEVLKKENSFKEFLSLCVALINSIADQQNHLMSDIIKKCVCCNLESSHIQFDLIEDNGKCFIFPKGVAELDEKLVYQNLIWLKDYPCSEKSWIKAVREYANCTDENASNVADGFRKALEAFFKEFFNTSKSLENCKSEYGGFLKAQGISKEITNNFEGILQQYTNFMNDHAKHNDATNKKILEYLMYQTGNIIRLLITLKQDEIICEE